MEPNNKNNKSYLFILSVIILSVIVSAITVFVLFQYNFNQLEFKFLTDNNCNKFERTTICVYSEDWNSEAYLSLISNFYDKLIAYFTGLIGVVVVAGFIYMKFSRASEIEQNVREILSSDYGTHVVSKAAETIFREKLSQHINSLVAKELQQKFEEVDRRIDEIEKTVIDEAYSNIIKNYPEFDEAPDVEE